MPVRISRIDVHAFRGIPQLALETDRKSVLIKGDNGTGKSSIIEALEFFFTGAVVHLQGTHGVSLTKHGPHIHYSKADVKVELTFDPGNIVLSRTMTTPPVRNKLLESQMSAASKGTFILRRSQILEFINDDPADRYSAIANIIGLESLDATELEMQRLRDDMKGDEEAKLETIDDMFLSVSQTLGEDVSSVDKVLAALNHKATEFGFPSLRSFKEIKKYTQKLYKSVKNKAEGMEAAKNLEELLKLLQEPIISEERLESLSSFADGANELISSNTRSSVRLLELLSGGREIIGIESSSQCPLCGQPIEKDSLMGTLESRISTLTQLSREASTLRQDWRLIEKSLEEAGGKLDSILGKMGSLKGVGAMSKRVKEHRLFLSDFISKLARAKDLVEPLTTVDLNYRSAQMVPVLDKIRTQVELELEKIGLTEDEKKLLEFIGMLGDAGGKVNSYDEMQLDYGIAIKHRIIAEKLYVSFSSVKKAKVHEIYLAILGDVNDFSARLHPNEGARSIQLDVDQTKRASANLLIDTLGKSQQDPRGLESEGHLDALGICIFLAFVKKFNNDIPLVLLDDVITTLDSGHRAKLAELLIEEFSDKQLLVTTHDNVWYEEFRAQERAFKKENDFKNVEIVGWTLASGPRIINNKPRVESIEQKLNDGDKQAAANEGRQYLEWILEKLCEEMEVSVQFKMPPRYEIGDLLPPARAKILKMIDDAGFKGRIESAFLGLEKTIPMGNLLSHNNVFSTDIAISEVRTFCDSVRNLHVVFSCPDCGSFLRYYRELLIIRCSNKKCDGSIEIRVRN